MFSRQKHFRLKKKINVVSETLSLLFRKHFAKQIEKESYNFCGRGPCVPPSVEDQCFHLRRLDLQILLCRCLAPDSVGATRSRATGARQRHRRICNSSLLKWKHWPSTEGGTHGHDHKTDAIFSVCFTKCFRNKSESVSETKINVFLKRKCFYLQNICEMKVFSKQK